MDLNEPTLDEATADENIKLRALALQMHLIYEPPTVKFLIYNLAHHTSPGV